MTIQVINMKRGWSDRFLPFDPVSSRLSQARFDRSYREAGKQGFLFSVWRAVGNDPAALAGVIDAFRTIESPF